VAKKVGLLSIDTAVTEKVLQHFTTFPRRGLFFAGITISHTGGHNSPPLPPAFSLRRSPAPFLPNLLFFPDSTLRSKDKSGLGVGTDGRTMWTVNGHGRISRSFENGVPPSRRVRGLGG